MARSVIHVSVIALDPTIAGLRIEAWGIRFKVSRNFPRFTQ